MPSNRASRPIRILGAIIGGSFIVLGFGELIVRLDDPAPLAFWLPTLWGGGALILYGVFGNSVSRQKSLWLVVMGTVLGLLPTLWTVLLPLLSIALLVLVFRRISGVPQI